VLVVEHHALVVGYAERVVFYERPMTVLARYVATRQRIGPRGVGSFIADAPRLVSNNLMIGYRLRKALRDLGARRPPTVAYIDHHHSHAAAAFFASPFDEATILTIDGIGEWATAAIGLGSRTGTRLLEELHYPDSLGLLYSYLTAWCGFEPNDGEYKLMGLAPYGTPVYLEALERIATLGPDGQFEVNAKSVGWYRPGSRNGRVLQDQLGARHAHPTTR